MEPSRHLRALDAFDSVAELPEAERDARLQWLQANEPDIAGAVRALFEAERAAGMLPTDPPPAVGASRVELDPPARVGAYRLAGLIGRGGMGAVYLGERIDGGFDQTVAIKLIRPGLIGAGAAEPFAEERRILARLHHPHIVQLYDGGVTAEGLSYIVMERADGVPLAEHVTSAGLAPPARLSLFLQVCQAVAYAHSQGVVHADIKPGNIIVDPRHGAKLLDFGIAGLIGRATEGAGRASTPLYASPQQIRGDPPSEGDDIHALGVLLAILTDGQSGVNAELAAVVSRARAADRVNRYATVADLIADVDRWRAMRPVHARPGRRRRELVFFWRRHRLAVSASALIAVILVAAAAIMAGLYVQAEHARVQADQRFNEVRRLSRYMLGDLTDALEQFPGTGPLRNTLAHRGRDYLEGLERIPDAPPDLRLEVAEGYAKTGLTLSKMGGQNAGDPRAGEIDLGRAEERLRHAIAAAPTDDGPILALSDVLVRRAGLAVSAHNQPVAAATMLSEACALAQGVMRRRPALALAKIEHARCLLAQAHRLDFLGDGAGPRRLADTALAELKTLARRSDPTQVALLEGQALAVKGDGDYADGASADSIADYEAEVAVLESLDHPDARALDMRAWAAYEIAGVLGDLARDREALAWIDRGVAASDAYRAFEDTPHAWRTVNAVHLQRATTLAALHRYDEAVAEASANIDLRRRIAKASPHDNLAVRAVPVGLRPLGDIEWSAGRHTAACDAWGQAMEAWTDLDRRGGVLGSDRSGEIVLLAGRLKRCGRLSWGKPVRPQDHR